MAENDLYLLYRGLLLPKIAHNEDSLKFIESFQMQDDDVIVVTYPKSGTTWMQEIIPLLLNGGDFTPVTTIPNWERMPSLEARAAGLVDKLSAPRTFVSHMPYHLMPSSLLSSKAKVIYVSRNPKDVLVSSFHFHHMAGFLHDPGTFEEFADQFLAGNVIFGKWTDHVKSWRNTDLGDRILYVTYEEMIQQDLHGALERMLVFLGKSLSKDTLKRITEHCRFKSMKLNNMSNYALVPETVMDTTKSFFLRKGIAGDWKNYFSPELESKFNKNISEELNGTDITFLWDEEHKQNPTS